MPNPLSEEDDFPFFSFTFEFIVELKKRKFYVRGHYQPLMYKILELIQR